MTTVLKLAYISTDVPATMFHELDAVRLRRPVATNDGLVLPASSLGAVIASWDFGASYEVEFSDPFYALAIVPCEDLEREPSSA